MQNKRAARAVRTYENNSVSPSAKRITTLNYHVNSSILP